MKKLLLSGLALTVVLLLPGFVFAAAGDVTLSTDVDLSVNSITLDVSGSTAAIESIEVGSTSFTAILQVGSHFKTSAPNLNQMSYNVLNTYNQSSNVDYVCNGSAATLEVTAVASTTVIVTPMSAVCADAVTADSSHTSRGDSRGGGAVAVAPVVTTVTPAVV